MNNKRYYTIVQVLLTLLVLSAAEVFDVTTVCRYGVEPSMINSTSTVYNNKLSIEIRARNNALGLPLIVHNSTPIEYNVGVNVEQCTFPVESCKWEKKNFEESPADDYQPLMPNKKESRYLYINRNMTRNLRFFKQLEFDFSTTDSYGHMAILLLDAAGDIASSDMYYIQLLNGRNGPCQLFKCSSSVGSTKQNIIGRTTRLCRLQDSERNRLRVFENKILGKISGNKRDEVTKEWRKLQNAELHALYSSPYIIRKIKSRRLRWTGHVARMGESRNAYRMLVERPEGKRPLWRPRCRWKGDIKVDLREVRYDDRDWINLAQDRDRWSAVMNLRIPKKLC
ncbi:hypothetical protein ANN_03968 [Periplaneta americana]|uniref:Uncharacterized protein n=1 Tax=Periplaneta americana TaxID=6978 RepID=A0ABQ8T985_PERAM|nr:hypothetical protein ANN_03968 [Periplaneta americana]